MQYEAQIHTASSQLQETVALMRSRGDQMFNDVHDILMRWSDTRSQDFARSELVQLIECRDQALATARLSMEVGDTVRDEIARGEQLLLQTIPHYEELARIVHSVTHDAQRAQDFAERASQEAKESQFQAEQALDGLSALGDP